MTEEQKKKQRQRIAANRLLKIIDGEITPEHPVALMQITNATITFEDKKIEANNINIDVNTELGHLIFTGFTKDGESFVESVSLHEVKVMNEFKFPEKDIRIFSDKDNWICTIRGKKDSTIKLTDDYLDMRKTERI
jgi:hypothetical protein